MTVAEKTAAQGVMLENRLKKKYAHLKKWAKRSEAGAFRLYDRDIPELPLAVDLYDFQDGGAGAGLWVCLYLYERPYEKDAAEEDAWLAKMGEVTAAALGVAADRVIRKTRIRLKDGKRYGLLGMPIFGVVREQGLLFHVDLGSRLDVGLFLDHRPLRSRVRKESSGKRVLNLFSYTGAFSVYAAAGGASLITSVDLSRRALEISTQNFALNKLPSENHEAVRSDAESFLRRSKRENRQWDLILLDPPTFSNSKKMTGVLDINTDWEFLVEECLAVLSGGGVLYFSTNSRTVKCKNTNSQYVMEDISATTIPEDFKRNPRIHQVWRISRK